MALSATSEYSHYQNQIKNKFSFGLPNKKLTKNLNSFNQYTVKSLAASATVSQTISKTVVVIFRHVDTLKP